MQNNMLIKSFIAECCQGMADRGRRGGLAVAMNLRPIWLSCRSPGCQSLTHESSAVDLPAEWYSRAIWLTCKSLALLSAARAQVFDHGPTVGCRAELEARLARMQSKLLRGEEMGGLAAAAEKKQQLLAARQREWQAQKDKAGTAYHHLPQPSCQGDF